MSPYNHGQLIQLQKFLDDVLAEEVACSSAVQRPSFSIGRVGIRPYEITHGSVFWDICESMNGREGVQEWKGGRQATVKAEEGVVDEGSERQICEHFDYPVPDAVIAVFSLYLIVKAVGAGERRCLVIAPEQDESMRLQAFKDEQVADGLDGVIASIDIVSKEDAAAAFGY